MAKHDKPKPEVHVTPTANPDKPFPNWLVLLGQATAGAVAALAVIYTAYRLWITPNPPDLELAKVTVGYEIHKPAFLRSILRRDFGCGKAETNKYRARLDVLPSPEMLRFSDADAQVYAWNEKSKVDLAWIIFLRIDNYSDSPVKKLVVRPAKGKPYESSSIPAKSSLAYFVDARAVADEHGDAFAVGSDEATVTFSVATAQGSVKSSLPKDQLNQSNVTDCGDDPRLLSPQRLDVRPAAS